MQISVRLQDYASLRFLLTIESVDTADILSGDRALTAAELAVLPAITEEATGATKAEAQSSAAAAATQAATTFIILCFSLLVRVLARVPRALRGA